MGRTQIQSGEYWIVEWHTHERSVLTVSSHTTDIWICELLDAKGFGGVGSHVHVAVERFLRRTSSGLGES